MPFEVFRRHQRKLLAIFAIMAMFGFVVSDSLPRLLNSNPGGRDQKVAELYGKSVYQSQLNEMARQRNRANLFVSGLGQFMSREVFGGLKQRDLVDAMILQHEADRLNIPATAEIGREWFRQITGGRMNGELFNVLFSRFSNEVSEEHLLADIANQVRLRKVRRLLGYPVVTPYDVYRSYRDQNERVGAKIVEMPVDSFLSKVSEPAASEVQALYDKYKDVLPDPARETPGFKIPRRVQLEILSLDGNALARGLRDKVTEAELRSYYENHKAEFEVPSELPADLFADQPDLTPPIIQSFSEVRGMLAPRLAEEKAQAEILDKFTRIKEAEMIPFADKYLAALDEQEEAKKQGSGSSVVLPTPQDLKAIADREGLNYEKTPLLSRQDVERLGQISTAEVGLTPLSGGRKFVDEMFDSKTGLYEPIELTDVLGTRFLVRKIKDEPPHVPTLEQVRSEVIVAWKMAQARPLAEKAASELASQIKAKGATLKDPKVDDFRVVTHSSHHAISDELHADIHVRAQPRGRDPHSRRAACWGSVPRRLLRSPARVGGRGAQSAQDRLLRHDPGPTRAGDFQRTLCAPNSDEFRYKNMAREQASRQQDEQWMGWLRQQAGLKPDWIPPDEAKKEEAARG